MHSDMTAVTVPSNKIILNEVKDNQALLEPSCGENQGIFQAHPMLRKEVARHVAAPPAVL